MSSLVHVLSDVAAKKYSSGLSNTSQKICEAKTVDRLRIKYDTAALRLGGMQILQALKARMVQSAVYFEPK